MELVERIAQLEEDNQRRRTRSRRLTQEEQVCRLFTPAFVGFKVGEFQGFRVPPGKGELVSLQPLAQW